MPHPAESQAGRYTPMPAYLSHKKVWALKIKGIVRDDGKMKLIFENPVFAALFFKTSELERKPIPEAGWYYVTYEDGYFSFSPADAFEKENTLLTTDSNPDGQWHSIGWAVKQLHNGTRVARRGWNRKGMFLILVPGSPFVVNRAPLLGVFPEGTEIDYQSHVDMKTADGSIVPWLYSQSDLFALDWEVAA